jgi:Domain of unknown function (DUF222)/HNH endonuclease
MVDPAGSFGGTGDGWDADLERGRREDFEAECLEIDEMAVLASHLAAATARFVNMVWRHHERHGSEAAGFVAYRCGITGREAAEYVRVAEALQELPAIRAAFGRGEITYAKVRALTRVATASSEEGLLELAAALTATQLQRALRVYRRVTAEEARQTHELECVNYWFEEDGSLMLRARLAAENGTLVVRALETARERVLDRRREERAAGDSAEETEVEPPRPLYVEALVDVAQAALAPTDEPGAPRARVVVHVDAAALVADGSGCCELHDGPVISPETARRLGCDADLVGQLDLDGLPISLGRARRTVTPALRRLLEARDRERCCFPGCERSRHLQAHHLHHWAHGGETRLDNLALLCWHHHRLVHEGGYTVEDDENGGLRFRNRSGLVISSVPRRPPPGSLEQLLAEHGMLELDIGPHTNRHGGGCFELFDLELTVSAISSVVERSTENVRRDRSDLRESLFALA